MVDFGSDQGRSVLGTSGAAVCAAKSHCGATAGISKERKRRAGSKDAVDGRALSNLSQPYDVPKAGSNPTGEGDTAFRTGSKSP